VDVVNRL